MNVGRDPLLGCFVLLFLAAFFLHFFSPAQCPNELSHLEAPYSAHTPGTVAVELTGESGRNGIYFIPRGTSLEGFLALAGAEKVDGKVEKKNRTVFTSAATVYLSSQTTEIAVRPLPAEKRLALGIPIDVNRSTREQLMLVPGIGEKTADKILEQREGNGSFRKLDDLMQVKGIKEKRLAKLRRYLCIGC